jgi:hypothetical protein
MPAIETSAARRPRSSKFPSAMLVRCPPSLPAAVARAADRGMTSTSAYVRGAVLEQLRRDGIDVVEADPAPTSNGERG